MNFGNSNSNGIDPFSNEFVIMCWVKDTKVMTGGCFYSQAIEKFGKAPIDKLLINDNMLGYDGDSLDWTYLGKQAMWIK